jgi:hypothetical protein
MMSLLPSAKEYLSTVGGADKKYGKGTAKVTNIQYISELSYFNQL